MLLEIASHPAPRGDSAYLVKYAGREHVSAKNTGFQHQGPVIQTLEDIKGCTRLTDVPHISALD